MRTNRRYSYAFLLTLLILSSVSAIRVAYAAAPTITSAEISDLDDTDNCYAMKKYYAFQVVVNDLDGAIDIFKIYLRANQSGTHRFEVWATDLDTTPTVFAIQTGATIIDLDTGNCDWQEAGDVGTATFKIRFEWDYTAEDDIELEVYVEDTDANSAGFTVKQTNYFDVVNRLTTTGLAPDHVYVGINTNVTISGSVRYATTIGGDTSSTSYPPDAQFTAVHIRNATDISVGSNATVSNGVFSVEFTIPNVIQTNTYHVYLDLLADYTDANASDGDTVIVYGVGGDEIYVSGTWNDVTLHRLYTTAIDTSWKNAVIQKDSPAADHKRIFEGTGMPPGYYGWNWVESKTCGGTIGLDAYLGLYHGLSSSRASVTIIIGDITRFDDDTPPDVPYLILTWTGSGQGWSSGTYNHRTTGTITLGATPTLDFSVAEPDAVSYNKLDELEGETVNVFIGYRDSWDHDWDQWASVHKNSWIDLGAGGI